MTLPVKVMILASSKGLIPIDFYELMNYCVFNPITRAPQLIQHPNRSECYYRIGDRGLAVDYLTSDQYMLATVSKLTNEEVYKFSVFSSEGTGLWHEFQLKMNLRNNTFSYLDYVKPVYVHDSFHWLTLDGRVLAFDTKKEEAIIIDLSELIYHQLS
ncbi:hypothetical protein HAX54_018913 [Datura stramonium]|uniref:F-box protein n=1 Tax=Datura stramonium TaxID=4076 RepID=A0ABS8S1N0_DATST|nr:hypothetical protein [Datura stramonium]